MQFIYAQTTVACKYHFNRMIKTENLCIDKSAFKVLQSLNHLSRVTPFPNSLVMLRSIPVILPNSVSENLIAVFDPFGQSTGENCQEILNMLINMH